ncbi:hypothetical protein EMN47_02035 [Prolixibacteraceae bacterium JC049]|nr:hypothetical protein [Prolixibacteraceae bacterium JC049]
MKVIVSHDVDHLYWGEHFFDRFLFGSIYRAFKEVLSNRESLLNVASRFLDFRLNNIDELILFDKQYGVKPTYFFGMDNALSLSYDYKKTELYINKVLESGGFVGLHGIDYNSKLHMSREKERLQKMLPEEYCFGIRNHYLRQSEKTKQIQFELGYLYDSTDYNDAPPSRIGNFLEFPISVMDVTIEREANYSLKEMKAITLKLIETFDDMNKPYFVVNFHDVYYRDSYSRMKQWYEWLIEYLYLQNYTFTSFNEECVNNR